MSPDLHAAPGQVVVSVAGSSLRHTNLPVKVTDADGSSSASSSIAAVTVGV